MKSESTSKYILWIKDSYNYTRYNCNSLDDILKQLILKIKKYIAKFLTPFVLNNIESPKIILNELNWSGVTPTYTFEGIKRKKHKAFKDGILDGVFLLKDFKVTIIYGNIKTDVFKIRTKKHVKWFAACGKEAIKICPWNKCLEFRNSKYQCKIVA